MVCSHRMRIDQDVVVRAIQKMQQGCKSMRSVAGAKFGTNRSSLSARMAGKVAVEAGFGSQAALSAEEENVTIFDLLVDAGSHYLGVTTQELKEGARKLCSDVRSLLWDPD